MKAIANYTIIIAGNSLTMGRPANIEILYAIMQVAAKRRGKTKYIKGKIYLKEQTIDFAFKINLI